LAGGKEVDPGLANALGDQKSNAADDERGAQKELVARFHEDSPRGPEYSDDLNIKRGGRPQLPRSNSPAARYLAHPSAAATARSQSASRRRRSNPSMCGSNRAIRRPASSSSVEPHTPNAIPARPAAPSAVVSTMSGRSTGTPRTSAWNCMSQSLVEAPPSTRSAGTDRCAAPAIAASSSARAKAIASSAARTR